MEKLKFGVDERGFGIFAFVSYYDEQGKYIYDCIYIYEHEKGYHFEKNSLDKCVFPNKYAAISAAHEALSDIHNTFEFALKKVNEGIEKSVLDMRHTLDLKMAEFRGLLFDQVQQLRV